MKTVGSNLQKKEIYSVIEKIEKLQITIEMETTNEKNMERRSRRKKRRPE